MVQSYTSLPDFQARFNQTAHALGLNINYVSMWAPFNRRDSTSMEYVSIYNSSALMDPAMWAPNYPSSGALGGRQTFTKHQFAKWFAKFHI